LEPAIKHVACILSDFQTHSHRSRAEAGRMRRE